MTDLASASKPHLVRTAVEELIADLDEGDPVPPERELAARFGVARETVRQALQELLVAGRVERRGRGTVVSTPKLVQPLTLESYNEAAAARGHTPRRLLVAWDNLPATAALARALGIGDGDDVMHIERVLLRDGTRIAVESTYLPASRFGYLRSSFDPSTSLYAAIRASGVDFGSAVERIEASLPTPREAALLESTPTMPMLLLTRRSLDTAGQPIELIRALYRGDRIAFESTLD